MNVHESSLVQNSRIRKANSALPALVVMGPETVAIRAGTEFNGKLFEADVIVPFAGMEAGSDYAIIFDPDTAVPRIEKLASAPSDPNILGGFHYAPGGNAPARRGGDDVPQINPCSLWDVAFRPSCPDPRGMVLVEAPHGKFWCDIYLTGADHLTNGTSAFGVTIADGGDPPQKPGSKGRFKKFDYETACAVMAHHGKGLLSVDEFFAAAFGVTEQSSHEGDPSTTQLDAPRTSKWGLMQATGNMWVWGHDGDPDNPRASGFGGSWFYGGSAGSRRANVAYNWPGNSSGYIGARGRGDHLQLD